MSKHKSKLEERFVMLAKLAGLAGFEREYRFATYAVGLGKGVRERLKQNHLQDWRFDFAWPLDGIAVEIQGGTWIGGAHSGGTGQRNDMRKINAAQELGWYVLQCDEALMPEVIDMVARLINAD